MQEILAGSLIFIIVIQTVLIGLLINWFLRRQKELEELALIEAKERREYLAQASTRMAVQTEGLRRDFVSGEKAAPEVDMASMGNRRMREAMS